MRAGQISTIIGCRQTGPESVLKLHHDKYAIDLKFWEIPFGHEVGTSPLIAVFIQAAGDFYLTIQLYIFFGLDTRTGGQQKMTNNLLISSPPFSLLAKSEFFFLRSD